MDFMVPNPMPYPDYVFTEQPTPAQLRQRAVEAMRDFLSIQWCTQKKIVHGKTGPVGGKVFIYDPYTVFAGLPYTNGDKGLFQFLEYYDHETGKLKFNGTGQEFNKLLGGTCAAGVMWGWSTVCHTLTGRFVNFYMVPKHGCYPVGDYKFDWSINSFLDYSTKQIIEDNGADCILDAYSKMQPADAVASSVKDHTMMAIEMPHVEYTPEGKIDPENSYIIIQDQCGGTGAGFHVKRDADNLIHYSGRTGFKFTFRMLLDQYYLPVTTAEFMGTEPYERAKVWFDGETPEDMDQLKKGFICSNYPMAVLKVILTDEWGIETLIDRHLFVKGEVESGLARKFPMKSMSDTIPAAVYVAMEYRENYTLRVEATATNGEKLVAASFPVRKG